VDVAQSAGIVPIDVAAWDADFIVGSCVKFLCGGPGAGFLWVNDRVLGECRPLDVGWFSHADPFEFDIHQFRYADSALRFWGGTPAILPYTVAANSLETLIEIGIGRVRAHSLELTQTIINSVSRKNLYTPARPARRGGTVVLDFGERQPEAGAAAGGCRRLDESRRAFRRPAHRHAAVPAHLYVQRRDRNGGFRPRSLRPRERIMGACSKEQS
jgi:kynureninase